MLLSMFKTSPVIATSYNSELLEQCDGTLPIAAVPFPLTLGKKLCVCMHVYTLEKFRQRPTEEVLATGYHLLVVNLREKGSNCSLGAMLPPLSQIPSSSPRKETFGSRSTMPKKSNPGPCRHSMEYKHFWKETFHPTSLEKIENMFSF